MNYEKLVKVLGAGTGQRHRDWTAGWTSDESWLDSQQDQNISFSPKHPDPFGGPPSHFIKGYRAILPQR